MWCAEDAVLRDAGLSADVFYALPAEVRQEVVAQYSSAGATAAATGTTTTAGPPALVRTKGGKKRLRAANTMHAFFASKQPKA